MTKELVNISKVSEKDLIKIVKENLSFKVRLMFLFVGLFGPIFPAWMLVALLKVFASLMIDCTDADEEIVRAMYILAGKVKQ
jgi:hypothetical protein